MQLLLTAAESRCRAGRLPGGTFGTELQEKGGLNFQTAASSLALTSRAIINHIADELVNVYCTIGTFVTKQHLC